MNLRDWLQSDVVMSLPPSVRRVGGAVARWLGVIPTASSHYEILTGAVDSTIRNGWQDPALPQRQWDAFAPVLAAMRSGRSREDFVALAAAINATAMENPLVVEIGCGSGWNHEVLQSLLKRTIRYVGSDYSFGMVRLGQTHYRDTPFLVGDAVALPFADRSCDIALSGTALMHILEYEQAIAETRRIAGRFAIFHTVTVHPHRETTILRKRAYGQWVVEVVFNEDHLLKMFREAGLSVRQTFKSLPYDLSHVTGDRSETKTYLCETGIRTA